MGSHFHADREPVEALTPPPASGGGVRGRVVGGVSGTVVPVVEVSAKGSTKPSLANDGPGCGRFRPGVGSKGSQPTVGK